MRFSGKTIRGSSLRILKHVGSFVITIKGKRWKFSIRKELRIKRRIDGMPDLQHAEKYAVWRKIYAMKLHEVEAVQREHEEHTDWVTVHMPKALAEQGLPRSDAQVRANVRLDAKVLKLRDRLTALHYELDLARMMCEAFEHRKAVLMKVRAKRSFNGD